MDVVEPLVREVGNVLLALLQLALGEPVQEFSNKLHRTYQHLKQG